MKQIPPYKKDINLRPVEQLLRAKKRMRSLLTGGAIALLAGSVIVACVYFPDQLLQSRQQQLAQLQAELAQKQQQAEAFDALKNQNDLLENHIQAIAEQFDVQAGALATIRMIQQCTPQAIQYQVMNVGSASINLTGSATRQAQIRTLAEQLHATGLFAQVSVTQVRQQQQTLVFEMTLVYPMQAAQAEAQPQQDIPQDTPEGVEE